MELAYQAWYVTSSLKQLYKAPRTLDWTIGTVIFIINDGNFILGLDR